MHNIMLNITMKTFAQFFDLRQCYAGLCGSSSSPLGQDVSSVDLNNKCDRVLSDASSVYTRIRYIVANNCGVASVTKNTSGPSHMKYERRLNKIRTKEGFPKTFPVCGMHCGRTYPKREHYNF